MNTKKLTTAEIAFVTEAVNKNLEIYDWTIVLSKDPQPITVTINNTEEKLNWYSFCVIIKDKEYQYCDCFPCEGGILGIISNITYQIWYKLDGKLNSDLLKKLLPQNDDVLLNYKKFLENKNE